MVRWSARILYRGALLCWEAFPTKGVDRRQQQRHLPWFWPRSHRAHPTIPCPMANGPAAREIPAEPAFPNCFLRPSPGLCHWANERRAEWGVSVLEVNCSGWIRTDVGKTGDDVRADSYLSPYRLRSRWLKGSNRSASVMSKPAASLTIFTIATFRSPRSTPPT